MSSDQDSKRTNEVPMTVDAWRTSVAGGLGIDPEAGRSESERGTFPYERLSEWVESAYLGLAGQAFVDAVQRNVRGLVNWVYGDGDEPFWPGADD